MASEHLLLAPDILDDFLARAVEENHSSVRVKNLKQLSNLSAETKTRKKKPSKLDNH